VGVTPFFGLSDDEPSPRFRFLKKKVFDKEIKYADK
jgi:hypothetical protein